MTCAQLGDKQIDPADHEGRKHALGACGVPVGPAERGSCGPLLI